jgi:inosose dehydratase
MEARPVRTVRNNIVDTTSYFFACGKQLITLSYVRPKSRFPGGITMALQVGAQTISWGETVHDKMPEIISFLSHEEYRGIETGMRHFDTHDAAKYRALYREAAVIPLGLHSGGQFWLPDAAEEERSKLVSAVSFAAEVGFQWVVVSGNKDETEESMVTAAKTYGELGSYCAQQGIGFAYHNHNWELANNGAILDRLIEHTGSEVRLVLDIAWAHIAGFAPETLMSRYGSRIAYVHVKDVRSGRFCELGTGEVDFSRYIPLFEEYQVPWLVVEQDYTDMEVETSMRINRDFLRSYRL